jgi:hypothetical protein
MARAVNSLETARRATVRESRWAALPAAQHADRLRNTPLKNTRPYLGGLNSLASQPKASVFKGSTGKETSSTRSQVEHSKVRCSKPRSPGEIPANPILCLQVGHIGRSTMEDLRIPVHWRIDIHFSKGRSVRCPTHGVNIGPNWAQAAFVLPTLKARPIIGVLPRPAEQQGLLMLHRARDLLMRQGFGLEVHGRMKAVFPTQEEAQKSAEILKARYPFASGQGV